MRIKFKEGVVFACMDHRVVAALPTIIDVWNVILGEAPTITSAREGEHSENSLHYEGRALDIRTRHLDEASRIKVKMALKQKLGHDWDIINEKTHMHIELDRRADR